MNVTLETYTKSMEQEQISELVSDEDEKALEELFLGDRVGGLGSVGGVMEPVQDDRDGVIGGEVVDIEIEEDVSRVEVSGWVDFRNYEENVGGEVEQLREEQLSVLSVPFLAEAMVGDVLFYF